MIHYHGTPITPRLVLHELHGRHFCVSYSDPRDAETCHRIGQSVMLDNGAFSFWKQGKATDWNGYRKWSEQWLDYQTTWVVLPDVIDGTERENDELIERFRFVKRGAPVWHIHESLERLERLVGFFDRVCFGSSGRYAVIGTPAWNNRINEAFNRICKGSGRPPAWIHMLRGMSLSGSIYPFSSVDSTDIARNHEQVRGRALQMAQRWDAIQCPGRWTTQPVAVELYG